MATEFSLGPKDQEAFGGPKWVPFNAGELDDIDFDILDPLEQEVLALYGVGLGALIAGQLLAGTMRGIRGTVWLARKLAGVDTPALAEFTINARKVQMKVVKPAGAKVPPVPAGTSSTSSEESPSATE